MPSANSPSAGSPKPFSLSLSSKSKPKPSSVKPSSSLAPRKGPYSALADPDSDPDESRPEPVTVTGFDSGKAVNEVSTHPSKGPLVIPSEKNRDWWEEASRRRKKGKNLLPPEVQAAVTAQAESTGAPAGPNDGVDGDGVEVSQEVGLRFSKDKLQQHRDDAGDTFMPDAKRPNGSADHPAPDGQEAKQTVDEEALAALLGNSTKPKSSLTIPSQNHLSRNGQPPIDGDTDVDDDDGYGPSFTNESDRFRVDVASRPDSASLADYAVIPVEEFGSAMLRGMGWSEGGRIGKRAIVSTNGAVKTTARGQQNVARAASGEGFAKPKEVQRRPALLGLGAKERPGGVDANVELGAWNKNPRAKVGGHKGGRGPRGKEALYNPVMLRDTATGEMITEEEAELRRAEARAAKDKGAGAERDWRDRRDREVGRGRRDEERAQSDSSERNGEKDHRKERTRDRSRSLDRRNGHGQSSSKRYRSRARGKDHGDGSSRRERSISAERKQYKRRERERDYDDYDRKERNRDRDRNHERHKDRDRHRDRRQH